MLAFISYRNNLDKSEGDRVSFEIEETEKGPAAKNVQRI
ncbi:MAG: cold shock domain-containing protein [Deltaproteobacteria bacterium]|nr:cold shock domain-containing protein [Deltaproteobacteria bacterium]